MDCCDYDNYVQLEELGHAEAVDWDLGTCKTCGTYLLRQWSEYRPNSVFIDKLTAAEGEAFKSSSGRARKMLLKQWYADH